MIVRANIGILMSRSATLMCCVIEISGFEIRMMYKQNVKEY